MVSQQQQQQQQNGSQAIWSEAGIVGGFESTTPHSASPDSAIVDPATLGSVVQDSAAADLTAVGAASAKQSQLHDVEFSQTSGHWPARVSLSQLLQTQQATSQVNGDTGHSSNSTGSSASLMFTEFSAAAAGPATAAISRDSVQPKMQLDKLQQPVQDLGMQFVGTFQQPCPAAACEGPEALSAQLIRHRYPQLFGQCPSVDTGSQLLTASVEPKPSSACATTVPHATTVSQAQPAMQAAAGSPAHLIASARGTLEAVQPAQSTASARRTVEAIQSSQSTASAHRTTQAIQPSQSTASAHCTIEAIQPNLDHAEQHASASVRLDQPASAAYRFKHCSVNSAGPSVAAELSLVELVLSRGEGSINSELPLDSGSSVGRAEQSVRSSSEATTSVSSKQSEAAPAAVAPTQAGQFVLAPAAEPKIQAGQLDQIPASVLQGEAGQFQEALFTQPMLLRSSSRKAGEHECSPLQNLLFISQAEFAASSVYVSCDV